MPSRWTSDLERVRTGQQARARTTQARLLEAAEALFGTAGLDGTSVSDIAGRAGASVGSFYHHFRTKEAALVAVFERLIEEAEATNAVALNPEEWEGTPAADILRAYIEMSLAIGRERPGQKRIMLEAANLDPSLRDRYVKMRAVLDDGLVALLLERRDEFGHPDPALAARFIVDQVNLTLTARLDTGALPPRFVGVSDDQLTAETMRLVLDYLQIDQT